MTTPAPSEQSEPDNTDVTRLAECVEAIGSSGFPKAISEYCMGLCGGDLVFLSAFFDDHQPVALYANHADEAQKAALELYLDIAYVLDPFFILFRRKGRDEVVTLADVAPDNFRRSEYYQTFYKAMRIADECGLMLHLDAKAALFFSFGFQSEDRRAKPGRLRAAIPVIAALVRRHWTVLTPERPDGTGRIAAHLEAAFEAFGASVLSPREGDIVRMILKGHSSKAIARAFDNSPETIKVHRKRIYSKLNVASQGGLLSVFLGALSKMPAAADGDPLQYLSGPDRPGPT